MSCVRLPHRELAIRAGAFAHDSFDVRHLLPAPQFIDFGRDEFEHFVEQAARLDFRFAAEIDQLAVEPVARGAPAVLIDDAPAIDAEAQCSAAAVCAGCTMTA